LVAHEGFERIDFVCRYRTIQAFDKQGGATLQTETQAKDRDGE
jgi:hypothetical protein